jgi:outer membrane receptor for monomeric catechols
LFALASLVAGGPALGRGKGRMISEYPPTAAAPSSAERAASRPGWTQIDRYRGTTTVITRKMLDDYNARTMCDALRLVPGVFAGGC